MVGRVEDVVIGFGAREIRLDFVVELRLQKDRNSALTVADGDASVKNMIAREGVQRTQELAGVAVENILAFLESV